MNCPKCNEEMDFEIGIHKSWIKTWYCECGYETDEDITGELIDYAVMQGEEA